MLLFAMLGLASVLGSISLGTRPERQRGVEQNPVCASARGALWDPDLHLLLLVFASVSVYSSTALAGCQPLFEPVMLS